MEKCPQLQRLRLQRTGHQGFFVGVPMEFDVSSKCCLRFGHSSFLFSMFHFVTGVLFKVVHEHCELSEASHVQASEEIRPARRNCRRSGKREDWFLRTWN